MTSPGPLRYLGAAQAAAEDLTHRAYVLSLLAQNISQAEVDALIAAGFAPNVKKDYVDAQDALNATKAFIDAGDATKLKLAQKEINNGIAGLGPSGRIGPARVNLPSTQRFPKPYVSPAAYNTGNVTAQGTETLLYPPVAVADPGFTYKLVVFGLVDANTSVDGEFPIIRVRQGSASGQLVATGAGCAESYTGGVQTDFLTEGGQPYNIPVWATTLDVVCLGAGGGGDSGSTFFAAGKGGSQGAATGATLTRGTDIPMGTNTLTITVGTGGTAGAANGGNGGNGGATTAIGVGWSGITGAGGAGGGSSNDDGRGPGTFTFHGHSYDGGANQTTPGQAGNPPGGGGAGGAGGFGSSDPGGAGAAGAAWVLAYPSPNVPYGPVTVVPSAYNAQAAINGATTLHVMMVRSGSAATVTATNLQPKLMIVPIPA